MRGDVTVFELQAVPASATRARHAAVALADALGASRDTRAGIAVAVTEAVSNVVVHAYRGGVAPSGVEIALAGDERALEVEIRDRGVGLRPRDDSPGVGLGLGLIAEFADRLEIADADGGGTCIRLRFSLP